MRSFELNSPQEARETRTFTSILCHNPTLATKSGIWLISRVILLPATDRTCSFIYFGPKVDRGGVDRTGFFGSVKKSSDFLLEWRQNPPSTTKSGVWPFSLLMEVPGRGITHSFATSDA